MKYKNRLAKLKENLKFLELNESKTLEKITMEKGFVIPINIDSVENVKGDNFNFNFFHIVQNMLFCTALCQELPLNVKYHEFLLKFFANTEKSLLKVLLDVRFFEDNLFRAGILLGFSSYSKDHESYLMAAYELIDLYQSESDITYLKMAKKELINSFNIKKKAYTAYLISYAYHSEKDYEMAITYQEIALELNPDEKLKIAIEEDLRELNLLLNINETKKLMGEGNYHGALDFLMKHNDDNSWEQKYMLGEIYLALEMPEQALENLKIALDLNPTEADIYESLGVASYFLSDITNSIKFLEHGLKLDPRHIEILKNLASLYSRTGRSEIAIKLLNKAKVFYPDDDEIEIIKNRIEERSDS